ncbi:hypothetical protein B8X02_11865 [Stenotrophomonas rhizophila]|uniref:hypothetical protein n=1 Tax=Stenotrophomonas rhizophila TaxID=216778 RepID=UPI000BA63E4B|nr:hypothetical protein [Stenotrophomonas rhizophila]PAK91743.1 hypothetical protein B8X02_11865 [Stenotrophomonas rhizophila]
MDIPSLPTDNLYKFAALAGLLLIVLGLAYPSSKIFEIELYQNEIDTDIALAEARAEAFRRLSDRLTERSPVTREQADQFEVARDAGFEGTAQIREKSKRARILLDQALFYFYVGIALLVFGAILSVWGFSNWLRLQRAADAIMLNELSGRSAFPPVGRHKAEGR